MLENLEMIIFSFGASLGFGIIFHIEKRSLFFAGLGGGLTRCVYILLSQFTAKTFLLALLPAMFAALFAEIMAMRNKMPSTVFLYPAVLPLIPGSLLYYICVNLILGDIEATLSYVEQCALTLAGICLGFVLISTFTYYRRVYYFEKNIESIVRKGIKKLFRKIFIHGR